MGAATGSAESGLRALAPLAVVLVLATVCFQLVPANTLESALVQGAALAVLAVGAVALTQPRALAGWGLHAAAGGWLWAVYVLALGFAAGLVSLVSLVSLVAAPGGIMEWGGVSLYCA